MPPTSLTQHAVSRSSCTTERRRGWVDVEMGVMDGYCIVAAELLRGAHWAQGIRPALPRSTPTM